MTPGVEEKSLRLALPKGRMQAEVFTLLAEAGLKVRAGSREYRPMIEGDQFDVKILKPQNIIEMLAAGSRDVGFAGADWVAELGADVIEVLDTGLDPVSLVAAAPNSLLDGGALRRRTGLVVASEYSQLTRGWIARAGLDARLVHSYGATEVFPPDDADLIVDNTATGATLAANQLTIIDTVMNSSTRLFANPRVLEVPASRAALEDLTMLLESVLVARQRVMLEVNVCAERLEALCAVLPCMREPTIAMLHGDAGFALKAAVRRSDLPRLIPLVKATGGTDLIVSALSQIVP